MTSGIGSIRPDLSSPSEPNFFIYTNDVPDMSRLYVEGVGLTVSKEFRQSNFSLTPSNKTLCYLDRLMAKKKACEKDFFDAVILNHEGNIAETATSNIYIVKDDTVHTPSLDSGILPGVTRKVISEILIDEGIEFIQEDISPERLFDTDECFITNSVIEVMPVKKIDDQTIGDKPGSITKRIHKAYRDKIMEYINQD